MSSLQELIAQYEGKVKNAGTARDYSENYEEIMKSIAGAYDSNYRGQKAMLESEAEEIGGRYRAERGSAYVNARKNAAVSNEQLASAGLARALKDEASSGVSEKSRAESAAAMTSAISGLNTLEASEKKDIDDKILSSKYDSELKTADALSSLELQKLSAEQSSEQFARQYDLDMYNSLLEAYSQQLAQEQAARQLAHDRQQAALSQAYTEIGTFGKIVSASAANAMGVAVGTTKKQLKNKK